MKLAAPCALLLPLAVCFAQPKAAKPEFEVAAVRPSDPDPANRILVGMSADPSIVRYDNLTLRAAIRGAFRVRDFQIVAPDWMENARFQIEAKLPVGASADQIPEMLQALLEERFKLETRRETKEMNVYALVVGRDGPKLKPSELNKSAELKDDSVPPAPTAMGTDGKPRQLVYFGGSSEDAFVGAPGANLLTFVGVLSRFTALPVMDMTGIEGLYDFTVRFAPEVSDGLRQVPANAPGAPIADPAPSLGDALKEYGLRIEKRKMPVEMLIVTHMERMPAEN